MAVLTGLLVVSRRLIRHWLDEVIVVNLLGAVILLTGVLHMISGIRAERLSRDQRVRGVLHFLLGAFECFLGVLLLLSPLERGPVTYWVGTIWALIFGTLVIGGALIEQFRKQPEPEAQ